MGLFNLIDLVESSITSFFSILLEDIITFFAEALVSIMSTSINVLEMPLVRNGIIYAQALAFTLLVLKAMNEAFQTYILYQNGDPDADPSGLLIRTSQAVAIVATLPWLVKQIFTFGTKVAEDVANLSTGGAEFLDITTLATIFLTGGKFLMVLIGIIMSVGMVFVGIQATIRGAELALASVVGPIMALNLTSNNRNTWNMWFKQVVIICTTQALQIFMLQGLMALLTTEIISGFGAIRALGWLWVTLKTPSWIKQFAYSTGFSGAVGGTAKQAGTFYVMRKMMAR